MSSSWVILSGLVALLAATLVLASPVARSDERRAWRPVTAGLILYAVAATWLSLRARGEPDAPAVHATDVVFTAAYACLLVGIARVGHVGRARPPASALVDALLVGVLVLVVAAATFLDGPTRALESDVVRSVPLLTFPLAALVILGLAAGMTVTRGRWREPRWILLGAGALMLAVTDVSALREVAGGDLVVSTWAHPLSLPAVLAIAAAPWVAGAPVRLSPPSFRWRLLAPGVVAASASAILIWDHFAPRSGATIVLCGIALGAALVRVTLTFRELEQLSQAHRLALTDDLTLLPNRRRLLQELGLAARESGGFALLVLDIDRFKEINDTLGHHVGDRMLVEIGERLRAGVSTGDHVARLGGDEFAVITASRELPLEEAKVSARQIQDALSAPITLGGMSLPVRASVGIALYPEHGTDAESLLKCADVAMYQAKGAGSGCEVYAIERDRFSLDRLTLGADLHHAAERDELRLAFQPIVDPRTGRLDCVEALVRWEHPTRGLLQPAAFIPIAESAGLMGSITPAVLRMAVARCESWRRDGLDVAVAVNLAASDLLGTGFVDTVREVLADCATDPARLRLEITEHGVLTDPLHAIEVLGEIRALGVGVSIDDFGTGNASIAHLRGLPVDEIKIDRSFAAGITRSRDDAAIVRSTIVLGHELGLRVVVEGIEDPEVLRLVTAWGADSVQGFLIARPCAGETIAENGPRYLSWLGEPRTSVEPGASLLRPTARPAEGTP
jgi:diguanylate cyclase (GGDEF)-like protein